MGIKGLKKYLESNPALHIGTPIPGNSHLHIDAYGWMFYLMQTPAGLEISRQFGGSYIALDTLVRDSYVFLLSCGLKLTFYFDGRDIPMKRITRTERNKKRVNSQAAIHDAITYVSETKLDQALLDLPPLTKLQYIHTLKSLKANIVDCKYEADQEMVLACKRANDQEPNAHYCYGDDT